MSIPGADVVDGKIVTSFELGLSSARWADALNAQFLQFIQKHSTAQTDRSKHT
jgi:hypothetical protein